MRTIYVLGAGFSKSCGIATDPEMLRALNETLPRVQSKLKSEPRTSIEHLLEQAFKRRNVGFEQFMSTLSGLKFMPYYLKVGKDIFSEIEAEIVGAPRDYLTEATAAINFNCSSKPVRTFSQSGHGARETEASLRLAYRVRWQPIAVTIIRYYCTPRLLLINPSGNVQKGNIYPVPGLLAG